MTLLQAPSTEIAVAEPDEAPLLAPVTVDMSWSRVHALTQSPPHRRPVLASTDALVCIRRSALIRTGTRMIKLLTARQLGGYLLGRRPGGFCYRSYDVAALRTAAELAMLTGDETPACQDVVFGLRWRALDPADYEIPFSMPVPDLPAYPGLASIRPHDRLGPPVLGTGFAPSSNHVIPEYVTADLADLPMPANAHLVAFGVDGAEVPLYRYLPEQRAWIRVFGPHWRHLLHGVPEVAPDQELVPTGDQLRGGTTLVGRYQGEMYEAVADPPHEYRLLANAGSAHYPVDGLARRTGYATWRAASCTVVRVDGEWLQLRLCRPDQHSVPTLGVHCVERGVYEVWAAATEVTGLRDVDHEYVLPLRSPG